MVAPTKRPRVEEEQAAIGGGDREHVAIALREDDRRGVERAILGREPVLDGQGVATERHHSVRRHVHLRPPPRCSRRRRRKRHIERPVGAERRAGGADDIRASGVPARHLLVRGRRVDRPHRIRGGAAAVRRCRVDEPVHEHERRGDRCSAAGRRPGSRSWCRRSRAACAAARHCPRRREDPRRRTGSVRRLWPLPVAEAAGGRTEVPVVRPAASARLPLAPVRRLRWTPRPPRRPALRPNAIASAGSAGPAWRAARRGSPTCSRARCRWPPRRSGASVQ